MCFCLLKSIFKMNYPSVTAFVELVHSSNGTTQREADSGRVKDHEPNHIKSKSRERKNTLVVPSHFTHTDVSHIKGETSIFSKMVFCIQTLPFQVCSSIFLIKTKLKSGHQVLTSVHFILSYKFLVGSIDQSGL